MSRDLFAEPIVITLLGEPVAAGRPRFSRNGHVYIPTKTRQELAAIRMAAQAQMNGRKPFDGALEVDYLAERQVPGSWSKKRQREALGGLRLPTARPDADNCLKCLDALTHIVWKDDAQICRLHFEKRFSDQPKTIIVVRAL